MNRFIKKCAPFTIAVMLMVGAVLPAGQAQAATIEELQSMIAQLMAQLQALKSGSTTTATSTVIAIGTEIETTDNLRVRDAASINAAYIATQPTGSKGVVVDGPIRRDGHNWYKVDYVTGVDGWNVGGWLRARTNLADNLATYVGYADGREFVRTEGVSRIKALDECKKYAADSKALVVRCTWNGKEIYVSTEANDTPRIKAVTYPVGTSVVTASGVFGAPKNGAPSVTGPTTVGYINWGDGTADEAITGLFASGQASVRVKHTYAAKGTYTITFKNLDGNIETETVKIRSVGAPATTTAATAEYFSYIDGEQYTQKDAITKADAIADCKAIVTANPGKEVHCTWDGKVAHANVALGLYKITYGSGSHGATENISQKLATANCLTNVAANPTDSITCTWGSKQLYPTTTAAVTPGKNVLGCERSVTTKLAAGKLACYGVWDYGDSFGGDAYTCGTLGQGTKGCVIDTPICESGKATAAVYNANAGFTTAQLATFGTYLKTTPAAVKAGMAGLWQYRCAAPATTTPAV